MNLTDYTGKLNSHEDYLKILKKLEARCKYIEIVILDKRESNELVDKFQSDILEIRKVSEWWGTKVKCKNNLYRIKASKNLFVHLAMYETFCKFYEYGSNEESLKRGDYSEFTNFGRDDIAFYDENDSYLLFTTTHEGQIAINQDLLV